MVGVVGSSPIAPTRFSVLNEPDSDEQENPPEEPGYRPGFRFLACVFDAAAHIPFFILTFV